MAASTPPFTEEYIVRSPKPPSTESLPKVSVAEMMVEKISSYDKELLALIDTNNNSNVTYGQLHERAAQFASALLRLGVEKTDFVMFYGENSFEYIIAMLGTVYLGLPFCPIPPSSQSFELSEQSRGANGTILVFGTEKVAIVERTATEAAYRETMRQFKVIVQMETAKPSEALKQLAVLKESGALIHSFEEMISQVAEGDNGPQLKTIPHFAVDDLKAEFLLCFTSGTSGVPKPAIHSHRSIALSMTRASWGNRSVGLPFIMWHPLGHVSGTFIALYTLYAGCSVILFEKSDLEPILQAVERYKAINFMMSANQAAPLAAIDYHKKYDLSSLKAINHGGSFIATSMLLAIRAKYKVATINVYGSTEFIDCVEGYGQPEVDEFLVGCVGHVKQGVEMKIVDLQTGKPLPPNENGEICFRGESCFSGYKGNPEATAKTIVDGWYHSGDVGYYDTQGRLFITDRIKEMIKYKLYSLIPAEIEDFVQRHPAVASACVVGVPHASEGHHIRAYVELVQGQKVSEEELANYVSENMGTQKKLRAGVRFIDSMPRTLIGKVDRQYFKKLVKDELITRTDL